MVKNERDFFRTLGQYLLRGLRPHTGEGGENTDLPSYAGYYSHNGRLTPYPTEKPRPATLVEPSRHLEAAGAVCSSISTSCRADS